MNCKLMCPQVEILLCYAARLHVIRILHFTGEPANIEKAIANRKSCLAFFFNSYAGQLLYEVLELMKRQGMQSSLIWRSRMAITINVLLMTACSKAGHQMLLSDENENIGCFVANVCVLQISDLICILMFTVRPFNLFMYEGICESEGMQYYNIILYNYSCVLARQEFFLFFFFFPWQAKNFYMTI